MTISFTRKISKLKTISVASCLLFGFNLHAKSVAVVTSLYGPSFVSIKGRVLPLRVGAEIEDFSSIFTEESGQVSFVDYYDHEYHLAGSGQVKFLNKTMELQRGYLWIQSHSPENRGTVHTSNSLVGFNRGEAILSFDSLEGKSQLLVRSGQFRFENSLQKELYENVRSGEFSFISNTYENGAPRVPTLVGEKSDQKITSLFYDIRPLTSGTSRYRVVAKKRPARRGRGIASEKVKQNDWGFIEQTKQNGDVNKQNFIESKQKNPTKNQHSLDEGYIIIRRSPAVIRGPSSFSKESYYKDKILLLKRKKLKRNPRDYSKKTAIPLTIYGLSSAKNTRPLKKSLAIRPPVIKINKAPVKSKLAVMPKKKARAPAALEGAQIPAKKRPIKESEFKSSMMENYKKQMRHSKEVNNLINDLKSYKMDYKKSY